MANRQVDGISELIMHPYELQQKLQTCLVGQILQDVDYTGCHLDLGHLAPCCGRLVQAVRWVRGNGHVWLALEAPELDDEPPGLFVPAGPVKRVSASPFAVNLWTAAGRMILGTAPQQGRDQYAVPETLTIQEATLFLQALDGNGRLTAISVREAFGIAHGRARNACSGWERAGWLNRRGRYRYISEAGAREARRVLEQGGNHDKAA